MKPSFLVAITMALLANTAFAQSSDVNPNNTKDVYTTFDKDTNSLLRAVRITNSKMHRIYENQQVDAYEYLDKIKIRNPQYYDNYLLDAKDHYFDFSQFFGYNYNHYEGTITVWPVIQLKKDGSLAQLIKIIEKDFEAVPSATRIETNAKGFVSQINFELKKDSFLKRSSGSIEQIKFLFNRIKVPQHEFLTKFVASNKQVELSIHSFFNTLVKNQTITLTPLYNMNQARSADVLIQDLKRKLGCANLKTDVRDSKIQNLTCEFDSVHQIPERLAVHSERVKFLTETIPDLKSRLSTLRAQFEEIKSREPVNTERIQLLEHKLNYLEKELNGLNMELP